jgi:hypothetical protein
VLGAGVVVGAFEELDEEVIPQPDTVDQYVEQTEPMSTLDRVHDTWLVTHELVLGTGLVVGALEELEVEVVPHPDIVEEYVEHTVPISMISEQETEVPTHELVLGAGLVVVVLELLEVVVPHPDIVEGYVEHTLPWSTLYKVQNTWLVTHELVLGAAVVGLAELVLEDELEELVLEELEVLVEQGI